MDHAASLKWPGGPIAGLDTGRSGRMDMPGDRKTQMGRNESNEKGNKQR